VELHLYHLSGTFSFEMAARFLENYCIPVAEYGTLSSGRKLPSFERNLLHSSLRVKYLSLLNMALAVSQKYWYLYTSTTWFHILEDVSLHFYGFMFT